MQVLDLPVRAAGDSDRSEPDPTPATLAGVGPVRRRGEEHAIGRSAGAGPTDTRPRVLIRQKLAETVDIAEALLAANLDLRLFRRAGQLVQIVENPEAGTPGLDRPATGASLEIVSPDLLREILDRCGRWVRTDHRGMEVAALPPMWVPKTLLARKPMHILRLERISSTPIFRPDGTVREEPGYDYPTGVFYDPGRTKFPPLKPYPEIDDAIAAWGELRDPFGDFKFASESDFSASLATLLALIARDAIDGPCPMTAIGAPTPGAGKGLLADAVAVIATGQKVSRMTPARDDNEMRKRILAIGFEGCPLVLVDNVSGSFGSPSIAAALTSTTFTDRVMGVSQIATVPMRAVWVLTGNNVAFRGDLGRRVLVCDLDPACEHPEDRTDFKYPELLDYLHEQRPRLVLAALTILRAYFFAGRPAHRKPRKGSFERWDDVVRGALLWIGAVDPLEGQERLREAGDSELQDLRSALHHWHERFADSPRTLSAALKEGAEDREMRESLAVLAGCEPNQLSAGKLGYAVRRVANRIVSGLCFRRESGTTGGSARWRVLKDPPSPTSSGDSWDRGDESVGGEMDREKQKPGGAD